VNTECARIHSCFRAFTELPVRISGRHLHVTTGQSGIQFRYRLVHLAEQ
jgi:hypothetical protein